MFSDPRKNIIEMNVGEGMKVADFGSGAGFYTFALADRVGEYGKIYAIDIMADHLAKIKREAERRGIKQVDFIHADLESAHGSALPPGSVDRVLITNILFQVDDPKLIAKEAKRVLKRTGKIAVIEWSGSPGLVGPHMDHVVKENEAMKIFIDEGLVLERKFDAGTHHYGLLFKLAQ